MKRLVILLALAACAPGPEWGACSGRDAYAATGPEIAAMQAAAAAGAAPASPTLFARMRVMTIGGGNTYVGDGSTPGAYRVALWGLFYGAGIPVTFTGTKVSITFQGSEQWVFSPPYDPAHNGYSNGSTAYLAAVDSAATGEISKMHPDAILLFAPGQSDIVLNNSASSAPARLATMLDHFIAQMPVGCHLYVTNLGPLLVGGVVDPTLDARRATYNAAIPAIVAARPRVTFIDAYTPLYNAGSFAGYMTNDQDLNYAGLAVVASLFYAAMGGHP